MSRKVLHGQRLAVAEVEDVAGAQQDRLGGGDLAGGLALAQQEGAVALGEVARQHGPLVELDEQVVAGDELPWARHGQDRRGGVLQAADLGGGRGAPDEDRAVQFDDLARGGPRFI